MNFKNNPVSIIGAIILPLSYILTLAILRNPDFIVHSLGLLSLPIWLVQWIAFLIGGWILAIIATILFLSLIGFLAGRLIDYLLTKTKRKKLAK